MIKFGFGKMPPAHGEKIGGKAKGSLGNSKQKEMAFINNIILQEKGKIREKLCRILADGGG